MGDRHDEHMIGLDRVEDAIGEDAGQGAADFSAIEDASTLRSFADARKDIFHGRDEAQVQIGLTRGVIACAILVLDQRVGVELVAHHRPTARRTRAAASSPGTVCT